MIKPAKIPEYTDAELGMVARLRTSGKSIAFISTQTGLDYDEVQVILKRFRDYFSQTHKKVSNT